MRSSAHFPCFAWAALAAALALGCSTSDGDDGGPGTDAGDVPGGQDASADGSGDKGADGTGDGTAEAGTDKTMDGPADAGTDKPGDAPTDGAASDGAPTDTAPADMAPPPATPIAVNSGATGGFTLSDGGSALYRFEGTAGQVYTVSPFDGFVVHPFVSRSAYVSPTSYEWTEDAAHHLAFVAPTTTTYYVLLHAKGGGASGYFQVADGGGLLAVEGSTVVMVPADYAPAVFHFPITPGTGYQITLTFSGGGTIGYQRSARAERSPTGNLLFSEEGGSGPSPLTTEAPSSAVAMSYSGHYYVYLAASTAVSVTVMVSAL